jgi:hypothetical protein
MQALASQRSLEMVSNHIPPPSTQLRCAWAFAPVREYVHVMRALGPNFLMAPSVETIVAFCHLHQLVEVDLPLFVNDFHPEMDLVLDRKTFIFALMHSPSLSFGDPSGMVYELLLDCFVHDDSTSGFDLFF